MRAPRHSLAIPCPLTLVGEDGLEVVERNIARRLRKVLARVDARGIDPCVAKWGIDAVGNPHWRFKRLGAFIWLPVVRYLCV